VEQVDTDALTGAKSGYLFRQIRTEDGSVEIKAFCASEPLGAAAAIAKAYGDGPSKNLQFQVVFLGGSELAPVQVGPTNYSEFAGTTPVVRLRTVIGTEESATTGYVGHLNSVVFQVFQSAYRAGAPTALKVEVPTLMGIGTPVSKNVVLDLLPADERMKALFQSCSSSPVAAPAQISSPPVASPEPVEMPIENSAAPAPEDAEEFEDNRNNPVAQ